MYTNTTTDSAVLVGTIHNDTLGTSTVSVDVSQFYSEIYTLSCINVFLIGCVIALLFVLIFAKGYQSNAR